MSLQKDAASHPSCRPSDPKRCHRCQHPPHAAAAGTVNRRNPPSTIVWTHQSVTAFICKSSTCAINALLHANNSSKFALCCGAVSSAPGRHRLSSSASVLFGSWASVQLVLGSRLDTSPSSAGGEWSNEVHQSIANGRLHERTLCPRQFAVPSCGQQSRGQMTTSYASDPTNASTSMPRHIVPRTSI